MNRAKNYDEAREKFFSYLLKKTFTRRQAEEFLTRAEIPEEFFNDLMTEAESMGLIDDEAYAKLFVDGHLTWGNLKISHELTSRGVSREEINAALDDAEDEISRAKELAEGWQNSGLADKKITARLLSRGFSSSAVRKAFS